MVGFLRVSFDRDALRLVIRKAQVVTAFHQRLFGLGEVRTDFSISSIAVWYCRAARSLRPNALLNDSSSSNW